MAASFAIGKYLKYVDADDYIYPWGLEMLVAMMEKNPTAGWGLCSLKQLQTQPYPILMNPREAYLQAYFGSGLFHKAPLSSIIRKDVFDAVSGFSNMRMVGDFEMWHRLAFNFPVLLMPDGIVWYRKHGDQEVNDIDRFAMNYEQITTSFLLNNRCPLSNGEVALIFKRRKARVIKNLILSLIKFRFVSLKKELKIFYHLIVNRKLHLKQK
jgi:glycosyltransferase involved in cell wall biosynthesis